MQQMGDFMERYKFFYGWKIVAASAIILAVSLGMYKTTSVFIKPVCESLGFGRSEFTLHRTIITLTNAFIVPVYGMAIKRFGVKKVLLIGASMLSLVTIGYSFANHLWHFYVLAFIYGIFYSAAHFMIIGILINCWFKDKREFATGLAYSGSGLGGAIMIPVVSRAIELVNWRFAYRFMGVLALAALIPITLFFVKDKPEDVGLKPYTLPREETGEEKQTKRSAFNMSLHESFQTSRFWLLSTAFFLISAFAAATNTHSTPYLSDIGYPTAMVSAVISVFMVFLTIGKIILGAVYDRFGTMAGNALVAISSLIFPVAALLSHLPVFPWIYAVSVGLANCGLSVPLSLLITRHFGFKDYPMIFSIFTMITALGASISVPLMGAAYDYSGSYRPAWIALFVLSVIISVCLAASEVIYRREVRDSLVSSKHNFSTSPSNPAGK
ncbi:MAG: MFS transporter [Firmicutes bacterium]|nr:MFS transporter [Bacillota bacterium]